MRILLIILICRDEKYGVLRRRRGAGIVGRLKGEPADHCDAGQTEYRECRDIFSVVCGMHGCVSGFFQYACGDYIRSVDKLSSVSGGSVFKKGEGFFGSSAPVSQYHETIGKMRKKYVL